MSQKDYNLKIIESLFRSPSHIRELARNLHTSQTTIARKVEALCKENVVDWKQEGKNKRVFIKKSLEARQYTLAVEALRLVTILKKYPSLRRIFELIQKNKKIKLAILFGSYAKGIARKDSDIDVYVETTDNKVKEEIEFIDSKISVKRGRYKKGSLLIKEIEKEHVILRGIEEYYEKNKFFE